MPPKDLKSNTLAYAAIDVGAREEVDKLETRVRAIEQLSGEIGSALWGDNVRRDNGLRSQVKRHDDQIIAFSERFTKMDKEWKEYLYVDRGETCHGIKALEKHLKEHEDMSAQQLAMEIAKYQTDANKEQVEQQLNTKKREANMQMLGIVLVALITAASAITSNIQTAQMQVALKTLEKQNTEVTK